MTMPENAAHAEAAPPGASRSGTPIGGVGCGGIEFGPDGAFRNLTINNNRTVRDRIPFAGETFLAVRTERAGQCRARMLQTTTALPFAAAGVDPCCVTPGELQWDGLYPRSDYVLKDPDAPIQVTWAVFAPVIPYDVDASTLPVVFFLFGLSNPGEEPVDASVMLHWENLCGCTAERRPADRGGVRTVLAPRQPRRSPEDPEPPPPTPIGLEFGVKGTYPTNAHGNYCILTQESEQVEVSYTTHDARDPAQLASVWTAFASAGALDNRLDPATRQGRHGAVCCGVRLEPGRRRTVLLALTWFCPRFEVDGTNQGNGYCLAFGDAKAAAFRALRHGHYFVRAVDDWHRRVLRSSLPRWFNVMLINNNHVLTTNTILTQTGRFAMFETPEAPLTGALDRRFHSSLGTLLFFPHLAYNELDQFAKAEPKDDRGRLYRYLGALCVDRPDLGDSRGEMMDLNAKFILMVYRDYHLTGRLADLRKIYPRLRDVLRYMLRKDVDRDGLPEGERFRNTYEGVLLDGVDSYSSSLWIAAIRAFAELSRLLGHEDAAAQCDALFDRAAAGFERRLWDEERGHYLLQDRPLAAQNDPGAPGRARDHRECIGGQLAGQWYADFLGLGCMFPREHVRRALDAIHRAHGEGRTIASWPALHATHYACLDIFHGDVDRGMAYIRRLYEAVHVRHGRAFNQPLYWNIEEDRPEGWGADRHMSAAAVWHVLYALQGFLLNVPDRQLWIRPHLPRGMHTLEAPLVTPVCFGWMAYQESAPNGRYRQRLQLSFDGPIQIRTLLLRVPDALEEVEVEAEGPVGCRINEWNLGTDGTDSLVEVCFRDAMSLTTPLTVTVRQTSGPSIQLEDPGHG